MSFQHTVKIPKDRIGAIIGKGGKVKQQIEKRCGVEIEIDSENGDATITGKKPVEQMEAFRAVEVITAISRGFSPERACRLFEDEEMLFQQVDLHEANRLNREAMQAKLRTLCAGQVPGDTQRNLQVEATWRGSTFKHVLVPVWVVHYTYGSRTFQVVANGYTGAIAGEQPYSWVKIALAVVAVLVLLVLLAPYFQ